MLDSVVTVAPTLRRLLIQINFRFNQSDIYQAGAFCFSNKYIYSPADSSTTPQHDCHVREVGLPGHSVLCIVPMFSAQHRFIIFQRPAQPPTLSSSPPLSSA